VPTRSDERIRVSHHLELLEAQIKAARIALDLLGTPFGSDMAQNLVLCATNVAISMTRDDTKEHLCRTRKES